MAANRSPFFLRREGDEIACPADDFFAMAESREAIGCTFGTDYPYPVS